MTEDSRPDPLIHSLLLFWEQIERALGIVAPRTVAEVGSESGGMTAALTRWAETHDARVVSIDPEHTAAAHELFAASDRLTLISGASPWALPDAGAAEFWIVDGDHNHWTVARELEHIFGSNSAPGGPRTDRLAILHDVGWPCARRDLYYAPDRLPADGRHEYSYEGGVTVGDPGLVAGGFRGEGSFACALSEGGEANGVLTAVEDLMATRSDLRLMTLPCIFGVGFLFSKSAPWARRLTSALKPLDDLELLRTLEANRLNLYLRLIQSQDDSVRERDELQAERRLSAQEQQLSAQLIADLEDQVLRLESENSDLLGRLAVTPVG